MFCFNVFVFALVVTIAACLFFLSILMKIICKQSSVFHSENCFFIVGFRREGKIVLCVLTSRVSPTNKYESFVVTSSLPLVSPRKFFLLLLSVENFHQTKKETGEILNLFLTTSKNVKVGWCLKENFDFTVCLSFFCCFVKLLFPICFWIAAPWHFITSSKTLGRIQKQEN